jgi:hypothetical protein
MSDDINANRCRGEHAIKWLIPMLFSCLPLAGCALFVPGVHDLRLVNVEPVEVDTLDLHDSWGDMRPKMLPTDVVGRITIITEANIHDIAEQSELNTWYLSRSVNQGGLSQVGPAFTMMVWISTTTRLTKPSRRFIAIESPRTTGMSRTLTKSILFRAPLRRVIRSNYASALAAET